MAKCPRCGADIFVGDESCPQCGKSLKQSEKKAGVLPILAAIFAAAAIALAIMIFLQRGKPRYEVVASSVDWSGAYAASKAAGGTLAAPKDSKEMDDLISLLESTGLDGAKLFLGMERIDGSDHYFWVDKNRSVRPDSASSPSSWTWPYWSAAPNTEKGYKYAYLEKTSDGWKLTSSKGTIDGEGMKGYIIAYN